MTTKTILSESKTGHKVMFIEISIFTRQSQPPQDLKATQNSEKVTMAGILTTHNSNTTDLMRYKSGTAIMTEVTMKTFGIDMSIYMVLIQNGSITKNTNTKIGNSIQDGLNMNQTFITQGTTIGSTECNLTIQILPMKSSISTKET